MESQRPAPNDVAGFPELTELGKRIEVLRIDRGLSKQHLARHAGTSRQQLWRVMTGKSELTPTLRARLAEVLGTSSSADAVSAARDSVAIRDYLANPIAIERTLATMPAGLGGRTVKRRMLDVLEDCAIASACALGAEFFELRRRVLAGEL